MDAKVHKKNDLCDNFIYLAFVNYTKHKVFSQKHTKIKNFL